MMVGAALALLLAAAADARAQTARVPAPFEPAIIHVDGGIYGRSFGSAFCDATDAVKQSCEGRISCSIRVDDTLCLPADIPQRVLIRELDVHYHCGSSSKQRAEMVEAPFSLRLSCVRGG